ncbi:MAG: galactose-1-phosphate uridylyltransferase [Candidatus Nanopelagicaceae bacterium]
MQLNGVIRSDREMADGRTIRYYDSKPTPRDAEDQRDKEDQPGFGELRFDPLVNEWIAISSHRQNRIFLPPKELCPLCPTKGELLTEIPDSDYEVVVFDNRSPSLRPLDPSENDFALPDYAGPETDSSRAIGKCEVICFTAEHGQSFNELTPQRVHTLLEAWRDRTHELSKEPFIRHIAPFENRGEEVGVTLHHPHGQIYAYSYLPPRVEKMLAIAKKYRDEFGRVLFDDILKRELADKTRIVAQNRDWVAFVPFAARYPFEIHLAPLSPVADLAELSTAQCETFPEIALEITKRLDGVFGIPMAYIATWHQAPVREGRDLLRLHWQITSVRRAPGKLKYLAGSESAMGAFIMDVRPEDSAKQLREVKL